MKQHMAKHVANVHLCNELLPSGERCRDKITSDDDHGDDVHKHIADQKMPPGAIGNKGAQYHASILSALWCKRN
jgi:hypothetical protein